MKEAIVSPDASVTIVDSPIPTPGPHDVLIRVVAASTNPKDWKFPSMTGKAHNSGDDAAGEVVAVGADVSEFRKGDRVAGMHCFPLPHGAFAEYAILRDYMTFHIPSHVSFEEAATLPMAMLTSAFGLFWVLDIPTPWQRAPEHNIPLIVYGASTSVGVCAIKLAAAAGIHPIVAVGSASSAFVEEYLDRKRGDTLVDYKAYPEPKELVAAIQKALRDAGVPDGRAQYAFDGVGEEGTYDLILSVAMAVPQVSNGDHAQNGEQAALTQGQDVRPRIATVQPQGPFPNADPSVDVLPTYCGLAHEAGPDAQRFAATVLHMTAAGLRDGWLRGHPHEVVPGGLDGLQDALARSKEGRIRGRKLVLRTIETDGAGRDAVDM